MGKLMSKFDTQFFFQILLLTQNNGCALMSHAEFPNLELCQLCRSLDALHDSCFGAGFKAYHGEVKLKILHQVFLSDSASYTTMMDVK